MLAFVATIRTIHGTLSHAGFLLQALTRLFYPSDEAQNCAKGNRHRYTLPVSDLRFE